MKKLIVAVLVVAMVFSLTACGKTVGPDATSQAPEEVKEPEEEAASEETVEEEQKAEESAPEEQETTEDAEVEDGEDAGSLNKEVAKTLFEKCANDFMDWAGLQYFYDPAKIDTLTTEVAIQMAADIAKTKLADEYEWVEDGIVIPSDALLEAEQNLFGTTYDVSQYDSSKTDYQMINVSADGTIIRRMGDWGLVVPGFDVETVTENSDGTFDVCLRYYEVLVEMDTKNYAEGCFMNFKVAANPDSEYGIRILDVAIHYDIPFTLSSYIAEEEYEIPMYNVTVGADNAGEYCPCFVMKCSEALEKVELCSLSMDYGEAEGVFGSETAVTDTQGPVGEKEYFLVYPGEVGESLPLVGVRLTDTKGEIHHYYLQISGKDGSAVVTEFEPF